MTMPLPNGLPGMHEIIVKTDAPLLIVFLSEGVSCSCMFKWITALFLISHVVQSVSWRFATTDAEVDTLDNFPMHLHFSDMILALLLWRSDTKKGIVCSNENTKSMHRWTLEALYLLFILTEKDLQERILWQTIIQSVYIFYLILEDSFELLIKIWFWLYVQCRRKYQKHNSTYHW